MTRSEMKNYNMILIAKISASLSEKIVEEIFPPGQKRVMEQAKFTYSPLDKAFEKQIKTIEDQGEK